MPRVTVSARRKLDTPLAERYPRPPVKLHLILLAVALSVAIAATLIWLSFR